MDSDRNQEQHLASHGVSVAVLGDWMRQPARRGYDVSQAPTLSDICSTRSRGVG